MRALVLAAAACSSTYAYSFHVDGAHPAPGGLEAVEDDDVKAEIQIDATSQGVRIDVTNKTDQVVQVDWGEVALLRADGHGTTLHPDTDLGWIQPGQVQSAHLFPLAFPRHDKAAMADDNQGFQLRVPMIVRREQKLYSYRLVAHVRKI